MEAPSKKSSLVKAVGSMSCIDVLSTAALNDVERQASSSINHYKTSHGLQKYHGP